MQTMMLSVSKRAQKIPAPVFRKPGGCFGKLLFNRRSNVYREMFQPHRLFTFIIFQWLSAAVRRECVTIFSRPCTIKRISLNVLRAFRRKIKILARARRKPGAVDRDIQTTRCRLPKIVTMCSPCSRRQVDEKQREWVRKSISTPTHDTAKLAKLNEKFHSWRRTFLLKLIMTVR